MSSGGIIDELNKIPPVTRFLCGATLAVTLPVNLQLVSPYSIVFVKDYVIRNFEVCPYVSLSAIFGVSNMMLVDMETIHLDVFCRYVYLRSERWAQAHLTPQLSGSGMSLLFDFIML